MILLNFSHPITAQQHSQMETLLSEPLERTIDLPVQFDLNQSFLPQLEALMAHIPLTSTELQSLPLVVNLPALNVIAALLLAELHGRLGYFPTVLRLSPVEGSAPVRFEVVELLDLQSVRENARKRRYE